MIWVANEFVGHPCPGANIIHFTKRTNIVLIVSGIELKDGEHGGTIREIQPGMNSTVSLITAENKSSSAKIFNVLCLISLHLALLPWWINTVAEFQGGIEKISERIFRAIQLIMANVRGS